MPTAIDLITAALRGEQPPWPDDMPTEAVLAMAHAHGAVALLHHRAPALPWPAPLLDRIRTEALALAAWELWHRQVLGQVLASFAAARIEPVLLKGTALAYSLYPDPAVRTRSDTDLIVPLASRERTDEALRCAGFSCLAEAGAEVASYQASYLLGGRDTHCLDVHWRINNSELLARLFTYEELRRDARPLPSIAPHALGASPVHSFLLACVHRGTHRQNPYYVDGVAYYEADRLIWLYDIHLLATTFDRGQWQQVVELAAAKGLCAVCLESLHAARSRFGTALASDVTSALSGASADEAPARYLASSKSRQQWMDFRAHASMQGRWQWVRRLLFPAPTYMLRKYAGVKLRWLPWLYLRRAAAAVVRNLLRARAGP